MTKSRYKQRPGWVAWGISAMNGMAGDYLHNRQNGLAIETAFYHQNRPLPLNGLAFQQAHPQPTAKLCVLVHGLGCHEGIWDFPDPRDPEQLTSYGALLHQHHGYTPLYVRYNTGVSIAENGKRISLLLGNLVDAYPIAINEIILIGHSMGGLVVRSACSQATHAELAWVAKLRRAFYLGTPHNGADLERVATTATTILAAVPNPVTTIVAKVLNLRSQGIKDLRTGILSEARTSSEAEQQQMVEWLAGVNHYLINGTLTNNPEHAITTLFGDGLVSVPRTSDTATAIPAAHRRVFAGVNHFQLTQDWGVYQQIEEWCHDNGTTHSPADPRCH